MTITIATDSPEKIKELETHLELVQTLLGSLNRESALAKSIVFTAQVLQGVYTQKRYLALVKKIKKGHIGLIDDAGIIPNLVHLGKENKSTKRPKKKKRHRK